MGRAKTSNNYNIKLNRLTFRQYLAFTLIYSKYLSDNSYPTFEEIKGAIQMKTDRMLNMTLEALEIKGLLYYDGKKIKVKEELLPLAERYFEPLMLSKDYIEYKQLKSYIQNVPTSQVDLESVQCKIIKNKNNTEIIRKLNNEDRIFHRWYDYLEDFPSSLIWEKINEYKVPKNGIILDPFVGSGTTLVTAKLLDIENIGFDVNPVATFVSKIKTEWLVDIDLLKKESKIIISDFKNTMPLLKDKRIKSEFLDSMGFIEAHQWLKPKTQNEVAYMKERINELDESSIKQILKLALIEAAIESSNVSFCPGTSFYPFRHKENFIDAFTHKINIVIEDITKINQIKSKFISSTVYTHDCRKASEIIEDNAVDFLITSPPYPNDLEYTRQTRLDMFLLDYVKNLEDVQKIKKNMIKGSTKLIYKESNSAKYVENFESVQVVANKISKSLGDKDWGWDYPRMIKEYFGDMYIALEEFNRIMKDNSYSLFVVGDQTYKKNLIPVGDIMIEMSKDLGYSSATKEIFRVRKSTIHNIPLNEEIVILKS